MQEQDNSVQNIGLQVEPKEGERTLLSCNTADIRSPSLGINNEFESDDAALEYLAQILVQAYFDYKNNEHEHSKTGIDILPGINKRTG